MHSVHSAALVELLTEPAVHSEGEVAPIEQKLPSGHGWQSDGAALPSAPVKLPAAHSVGVTAPASQ